MKTVSYHLERVLELATEFNKDIVRQELRNVLESNKDYRRKADYIGFSLSSLDDKLSVINEQLLELTSYRSQLEKSKDIVLCLGAEVLKEYGIMKLEGAGIESLTVIKKEVDSPIKSLVVNNSKALIDAGFRKIVLDEEAVVRSYNDGLYLDLIEANVDIVIKRNNKKEVLKVNKRNTVTTRLAS